MKTNRWLQKFSSLAVCFLLAGCVTRAKFSPCEKSHVQLRANQVITVADDFVVDVYLNGTCVPDDQRRQLAEIFGATVEQVDVQVHQGDWLVFHVVNDRLRWNGNYYFAAAGIFQKNEFGFVSELESGRWSACDDAGKSRRFIAEKNFLAQRQAQPISNRWAEGTPRMKEFAGAGWSGQPLWGLSRDTWLKVIVK